MNRRHFLVVLGSAAAAVATKDAWGDTDAPPATFFDAGPLADFDEAKVYEQFRDQGVLLIRRGDDVFALSPICTHKVARSERRTINHSCANAIRAGFIRMGKY